MHCYSEAQGEGPLQPKFSSQLNTATHIVFNIGPLSAFWSSNSSALHYNDACKSVSVCALLRIENNDMLEAFLQDFDTLND